MPATINELIDANEAQIFDVKKELDRIRMQLRKPASDKMLDALGKRFEELQILGRRLLEQRAILHEQLTGRTSRLISSKITREKKGATVKKEVKKPVLPPRRFA